MLYRSTVLILISLLILTGCRSKKRTTESAKTNRSERVVVSKESESKSTFKKPPANASYSEVVSTYIDNYSSIAREEMLQYGIPASITLAQGILESGAGRGELTRKANNHFGIKCHTGGPSRRKF